MERSRVFLELCNLFRLGSICFHHFQDCCLVLLEGRYEVQEHLPCLFNSFILGFSLTLCVDVFPFFRPFDGLSNSCFRVTKDFFFAWFNVFSQCFGFLIKQLLAKGAYLLVTLLDEGFLVLQLLFVLCHPFFKLLELGWGWFGLCFGGVRGFRCRGFGRSLCLGCITLGGRCIEHQLKFFGSGIVDGGHLVNFHSVLLSSMVLFLLYNY